MSEMLGNCPGLNVYRTHIPRDKQFKKCPY